MLNQFSRTQLLVGKEAIDKFRNARVAVFGIGGVGGYVCEGLVRSGIGAFDLIDDDKVCLATVYKGNIIKNLIMDCQSYTKYRPNETTGGIFVSWRRKEELPTGA